MGDSGVQHKDDLGSCTSAMAEAYYMNKAVPQAVVALRGRRSAETNPTPAILDGHSQACITRLAF